MARKRQQSEFDKWVARLSTEERLSHASQSIAGVNNVAQFLITLHETNQLVSYTDLLSKQVESSYAANAYQTFVRGLQEIELVRLCSLWDRGEQGAFSIPTIIGLIDNDGVIDCITSIAAKSRQHHDSAESDDEHDDEWALKQELLIRIGQRESEKERRRICVYTRRVIQDAMEIVDSDLLRNVVNFRNKYIAHATGLTRLEKAENGSIPLPRYDDETELLVRTLRVMERLDLCVRGVSVEWDEYREIAKRNSKYLWHGVKIKPIK